MQPRPKIPPIAVVDATRTLGNLLTRVTRKLAPPPIALLEIVASQWRFHALGVVARLGIADLLAGGPREVAELARATATHEDSLFRVLRALASDGLLERPADRVFGLNDILAPLRSDHPSSLLQTVIQITAAWSQRTWEGLGQSVRDGQPAFERIFGKTLWAFFADQPQEGRHFHASMTELSRLDIGPIAAAYDFSPHRRILDLGGGSGQLLAGILAAYPALRGAVYDGEQATAEASAHFSAAGVSERAEVLHGSFYEKAPAGYDLYLMRQIAHGHSDDAMAPVLKNLHAVMTDDAKLLVLDALVPEGGRGPHPAFLDLQMLVGSGGRERTRTEMARMLHRGGFRLLDVIRTPSLTAVFIAERG